MVMEGHTDRSGLIAIMRSICGCRRDGLLAVQSEHDLISLTFRNGAIVAADAMNESMEDVLGEVLASEGLVSPADFRQVVEPIQGSGRLPGDVLVERELLQRGDLLRAVRRQILRQAMQLLRWHRGEYTWSPGAESPFHAGVAPVSVADLLVEAAEEIGDPGLWPRLDQAYLAVGGQESSIRVVGRDGDWIEADTASIWLLPEEYDLWRGFAEPRRLSEIGGADSTAEVRYGLRVLLEAGLLVAAPRDPLKPVSEPLFGGGYSAGDVGASGSGLEQYSLPAPWDRPPTAAELTGEPVLTDTGNEALLGTEWWREEPKKKRGPAADYSQLILLWLSRSLAIVLLVALCWAVLVSRRAAGLWLPYFWQEPSRSQLTDSQRSAVLLKAENAMRAFHLVYGRYPDEIELLVDLGMLERADLHDLAGRFLRLSSEGDGYRMGFSAAGDSRNSALESATPTEDYFLDRSLLSLLEAGDQPAVVVLD